MKLQHEHIVAWVIANGFEGPSKAQFLIFIALAPEDPTQEYGKNPGRAQVGSCNSGCSAFGSLLAENGISKVTFWLPFDPK